MIPDVGITFNEQHSARLMAHLEKVILGSTAQEGDPLYGTAVGGWVCSERRQRGAPEAGQCEAQGEAQAKAPAGSN